MAKLKPCPFCGCTAVIKIEVNYDEFESFVAVCINHECKIKTPKYNDFAKSVEAWNRRV